MTTIYTPLAPLNERVGAVGTNLVNARKKSSAAAVVYVQSVGVDEASGDKLSHTTIEAAEAYDKALGEEQEALRAYRTVIREVIEEGRVWHLLKGTTKHTLN